MKKKSLLFILFLANLTYCQDFDSTSRLDTIYVSFTKDKNQDKIFIKKDDKPSMLTSLNGYYYYFPCPSIGNCRFFFHTGGSMKQVDGTIKLMDVKKVKKSFLAINKDKIIDMSFFLKYGQLKCLEIFKEGNKDKVVYIIDKEEVKKRRIILRQAKLISMYPYEE